MIDIDQLEALAKSADSGIWAMGQSIIETNGGVIECTRDNYDTHDENMQFVAAANPAAILALVAEVRALREDAERYRWLRDKANSMGHVKRAPLVLMTRDDCSNNGWEDVLIGEGLDKAIDAARGVK